MNATGAGLDAIYLVPFTLPSLALSQNNKDKQKQNKIKMMERNGK